MYVLFLISCGKRRTVNDATLYIVGIYLNVSKIANEKNSWHAVKSQFSRNNDMNEATIEMFC
jgi:hypothetical protein